MTPTFCLSAFLSLAFTAPNGLLERKLAIPNRDTEEAYGVVVAIDGNKSVSLRDPKTKEVKRYPLLAALSRGEVLVGLKECNGYAPADLQIGDTIYLALAEIGKTTGGVTIQIWDRPNGKIPPSRVVKKRAGERYHDEMNAIREHKKNGTPLPAFMQPLAPPKPIK